MVKNDSEKVGQNRKAFYIGYTAMTALDKSLPTVILECKLKPFWKR